MDKSLQKKGVILDSVSHIDVVYFAPEPEVEENVNSTSSAGEADNDGTSDAASAFAGEMGTSDAGNAAATNDENPTSTSPTSKRRNDGGRLAVNLLVRGHYNQNTNVDFDYIVQGEL